MAKQQRKKKPVDNIPQGKPAPKESLTERVRRHVSDINSTISDDDIRNVKIEPGHALPVPPPELAGASTDEVELTKEEQEEKKKNEGEEKKITPWDVLSE
jgi:hypothetical protein